MAGIRGSMGLGICLALAAASGNADVNFKQYGPVLYDMAAAAVSRPGGTAVDANGDAYSVGSRNGNLVFTRASDLLGTVEKKLVYPGVSVDRVLRVVLDGDFIWASGHYAADTMGFIVKMDKAGTIVSKYIGNMVNDIAVDPVDHSLWGVWSDPMNARVVNFRDGGGGNLLVEKTDNYALDGLACAIAVTPEHIYVGGRRNMPTTEPWLLKRRRLDAAPIWTQFYGAGGNDLIRSICPRGNKIYTMMVKDEAAMGYSCHMTIIDAESRNQELTAKVCSFNTGMGWNWYETGGMVLHPTAALAVVSSGNIITARNLLNGSEFVTRSFAVDVGQVGMGHPGVAAGPAFVMYAEAHKAPPGNEALYGVAVEAVPADLEKDVMIIAPNKLVYARRNTIAITIKSGKEGDKEVRIYDTGGRYVTTLKAPSDSSGKATIVFDGNVLEGPRKGYIAPGAYYAVPTENPAKKKLFMVIEKEEK